MSEERAALEERKAQALRDLVEVERQLQAGEIDGPTAERLTQRYEAEVVSTVEALSAPAAEKTRRRWSAGRLAATAVLVLGALAAIVALAARATEPRPDNGFVTGNVGSRPPPRDLSQVSNEEMERVIAANPGVTPMRLALVERYLRAGDVEKAQRHAQAALETNPSPTDRQRALKYLGWTTAVRGQPAEGARLLEQSLAMAPADLDAQWFLANVRLTGLGDRHGATTLLESILRAGIPADKRAVVERKLAEARGQPAPPGPPASPPKP